MTTTGVVYIAFGVKARAEAAASIASLQAHHTLPVAVVSDAPLPSVRGVTYLESAGLTAGTPGRMAKVHLDRLTPFEHTLYLDADTRVHGQLWAGFRLHGESKSMTVARLCWPEMMRVHYRDGGSRWSVLNAKYLVRRAIEPVIPLRMRWRRLRFRLEGRGRSSG